MSMEDYYNKIFNIFNNTTYNEGIKHYISFIQKENQYLISHIWVEEFKHLDNIAKFSYSTSQLRSELNKIFHQFHKASQNSTHVVFKTYALLGCMVCMWFNQDYYVVQQIQKEIGQLRYDTTWWERNKGKLAGIGGGGIAAAAALAIAGATTAVITGPLLAAVIMKNYKEFKGEDVEESQKRFKNLQDAICRINFNIQ